MHAITTYKPLYTLGAAIACSLMLHIVILLWTNGLLVQLPVAPKAPNQISLEFAVMAKSEPSKPQPTVAKAAPTTVARRMEATKPAQDTASTRQATQPSAAPKTAEILQKIPTSPAQTAQAPSPKAATHIPVTHSPRYHHYEPPRYPAGARRRNQEGTVVIRALVSARGKTENIKIHRSSGYQLLDNAAIKAARKWRFMPHERRGQQQMAWIQVPIDFVIK